MIQTRQKPSELSQNVPNCPKMSTSDASVSEQTCFCLFCFLNSGVFFFCLLKLEVSPIGQSLKLIRIPGRRIAVDQLGPSSARRQ